MQSQTTPQTPIVIYQSADGSIATEVRLERDTLWLSLQQIADLFGRDKSVISRHLRNIFESNELKQESVVAKNATTAADGKTYQVDYYNLDAIISVGYRVNSVQGTRFRIWANRILKDYLVQGYALNQQRLEAQQEKMAELKQAIALSARLIHNKELSNTESQGILAILEKYSHALTVLDDYDHQRLQVVGTRTRALPKIAYAEAMQQILLWRQQENLGGLFGNEKDESFKSSLETIYQTFDGKELYPSIEEKAANLLYFIVKNHSFTDGNKRIAAAIFVWFLQRHDFLYNAEGEKRIADNALVAFTLLIAESKPDEREMMVKVIINLINGKNV
ncbi:MAG: virulence RhuM family protein [Gammaproteobacteria bacterium]|nr:virulence RhuM family protein [Gammaproteobacteria bacterium]MBU1776891.1 virulence RhuM family protein [Gammaproteobacteria bacterium]MBU1968625.1 virulence RhuM family protein [Gammaproteobacteria bacterium]